MSARSGPGAFKKLPQVPPPFQDVEKWGWVGLEGPGGQWDGDWSARTRGVSEQRQVFNLGRARARPAGTAAQPSGLKQFGGR